MTDNVVVNDLPRRAITRTAKLATLPVGLAGRTALGLGKRIGGRPAELVATEIQQRTAEQLFKVLGELKGGAMKFGQALSVFEAALPEELAAPYRSARARWTQRRQGVTPGTTSGPTCAVVSRTTTSRCGRRRTVAHHPSCGCVPGDWATMG